MRHTLRIGAAAVVAAVAFWSCKDSTTSPAASLSLSAASRAVTIGEDSVGVLADSVTVTAAGTGAAPRAWTASHGGASWLTLLTTSGTGSGVLRWERDAGPLFAGTYVDTITVTETGAAVASVRLVDTLVVRAVPSQYISVRRAWRPGERDSAIAFVVGTRAWDEWSELAPLVMPGWDSTTEIVLNPLWRPLARLSGPVLAPLWGTTGWSTLGLDIRIVFDSIPGGTVQKDSLDWVRTFWYRTSEQGWKGFVVKATTSATWNASPASGSTLNTTAFDASGGKTGLAGGEARLRVDSATYWQANSGTYFLSYNGGYGATIYSFSGATDPYKGGNYLTGGFFGGRLQSVKMPRQSGNTLPTTYTIDWDFRTVRINAQRIFCYFTPVPPPVNYTSCTGPAFARIVALARAGRAAEAMMGPRGGRGR
jgi:hypothetical protein